MGRMSFFGHPRMRMSLRMSHFQNPRMRIHLRMCNFLHPRMQMFHFHIRVDADAAADVRLILSRSNYDFK